MKSRIALLFALAVVVAQIPYLKCSHGTMPVTVPGLWSFMLFVVFAIGLIARFQRAHRDPRREAQRHRARLSARRWAAEVPLHSPRTRRDPDPALPLDRRKQ